MNEIREIWGKFDELITTAESPDTKAIIEAIKLQTDLLNRRLASLDNILGMMARLPPK